MLPMLPAVVIFDVLSTLFVFGVAITTVALQRVADVLVACAHHQRHGQHSDRTTVCLRPKLVYWSQQRRYSRVSLGRDGGHGCESGLAAVLGAPPHRWCSCPHPPVLLSRPHQRSAARPDAATASSH